MRVAGWDLELVVVSLAGGILGATVVQMAFHAWRRRWVKREGARRARDRGLGPSDRKEGEAPVVGAFYQMVDEPKGFDVFAEVMSVEETDGVDQVFYKLWVKKDLPPKAGQLALKTRMDVESFRRLYMKRVTPEGDPYVGEETSRAS